MSERPPSMDVLLDQLLGRAVKSTPIASVDEWWVVHRRAVSETVGVQVPTAHAAVLGGFAADRTAYAFASGYVEAMRHLLGTREVAPRALCATEEGGGHPRAIECNLELAGEGRGEGVGGRLDGTKSFVTLGDRARELVVVATTGRGRGPDGRKQLRAVRIPANREGVVIEPLPALRFVPELPHARVVFHNVSIHSREVLAGDGYLSVLKPFRTIEDIHVHLGLLGWLWRLGREHGWDDDANDRTLALIATFVALASAIDPLSPGLHRALGSALAQVRQHLEDLEQHGAWARLPESVRTRWIRDRKLLDLAGNVRARRLATARGETPA